MTSDERQEYVTQDFSDLQKGLILFLTHWVEPKTPQNAACGKAKHGSRRRELISSNRFRSEQNRPAELTTNVWLKAAITLWN